MENKQRNLILAAAGIGLQTIGGICLVIAAVGVVKDVNRQIKRSVYRELSKQLAEEETTAMM